MFHRTRSAMTSTPSELEGWTDGTFSRKETMVKGAPPSSLAQGLTVLLQGVCWCLLKNHLLSELKERVAG
jgi:hypothetical protein